MLLLNRLLPTLFLCLTCGLAAAADPVADKQNAAAKPAVKPLKVLIISGGCCHDYKQQQKLLSEGIAKRAHVEFTLYYSDSTGTNTKFAVYDKENWAAGFDAVIHNECSSDVKEPAFTQRILKPHAEGLPAVVIHCAMHCYRDGTDEWFKFLGVTSRGHGPHYAFTAQNMARENPIMEGFGASWKTPKGELYHIDKVWDTATVLAHAERQAKDPNKQTLDAVIWTNQYGKGRVFGTTVGHYNEEMADPVFLNYVTRGLLWSCDKLNADYLKTYNPADDKEPAGPQPTPAPEKGLGK